MPDYRGNGRPAIRVDGVSKAFRIPEEQMHTLKERALHPLRRTGHHTFRALEDVSFDVKEGEFFGIVGRNGSGKSTLLKCLAGIYSADRGNIWIRGRMSPFIELGVGFNPDLAARDNVVLNGIMLGLSPREARARYDHVIEFAELEEFQELKLKNYSSGMHVRLAFSVAIQVDADVLLIDEVLAVGDASFQQKCFDVFNRLRDAGTTIVLVTHDMGAVTRFCHQAVLLERGEIVAHGEPEDVANHYLELNFNRDAPEHTVGAARAGNGAARIVVSARARAALLRARRIRPGGRGSGPDGRVRERERGPGPGRQHRHRARAHGTLRRRRGGGVLGRVHKRARARALLHDRHDLAPRTRPRAARPLGARDVDRRAGLGVAGRRHRHPDSLQHRALTELRPPSCGGRVNTVDYAELGPPIRGPSALSGDWRRFWHLTFTIARTEFKLRFYGSALGYVWQLVRPLLMFGVLDLVYSLGKLGAIPHYAVSSTARTSSARSSFPA